MDPVIIVCAKYLILAVIGLVIWILLKAKYPKQASLALAIIITGLAALLLTKIAGSLYFHPRPFVVEHIKPLVKHGADNGFPSEHTVLAMSLSMLVYFYARRLAGWAFGITLLVGVGRVLAHVHSPIDILAGLVIGALAGTFGWWAAGKLPAAYLPKRRG